MAVSGRDDPSDLDGHQSLAGRAARGVGVGLAERIACEKRALLMNPASSSLNRVDRPLYRWVCEKKDALIHTFERIVHDVE
jgi:hypothetical protein